ncbi:ATP-binding protein [Sulfitobacter guttiformis]|uniref:Serine/threonine-protein kinase RsbW n=1 Tax=Sulfitobacter guttiformis TaxID=74349 RepID=A0A420DSK0_9RHOB|nr:ATP-binding protein [Sulfitobacter guttiformis]KIN74729.1 Serine-protein kinase [Sulfitobacter guttiformis KCTC 32187]RKE97304.1 serine/threonine-protein kinase RsbW [Sulfitobacter guttiformis]
MADFPPFSVKLGGAEGDVRDGLAEAMACLEPLNLSSDETGTVELVLAEALNNVVEHALAAMHGQTTIEIQGCHSATGLRLTLIDCGAPMPMGTAPIPLAPDLDVPRNDIPEGGFGWFMIYALATEVHYSRIGRANHLSLQLRVGV